MKILVTGASGFVGRKIMKTYENAVAAPSLRTMSGEDIRSMIGESGADVIIHTAAISDMNVCGKDPYASYHANVVIPVMLAEACQDRKLICFSTDQVYNACKVPGPYKEDDEAPGNVYAVHKLEMEKRVLDILPSSVMLRAEWMYDMVSSRSNYLKILLEAEENVSFSSSQYRGVTYLKEVAENMIKVIELPGGAYNFGSETDRPMYEITSDFLRYLGRDIRVEDSRSGRDLWMDCSKARNFGVDFSSVDDGLRKCALDYGL